MSTGSEVKTRILDAVSGSPRGRMRPIALERLLRKEGPSSRQEIRKALNALVRSGSLVYTYRDPCSFVEIPASAVAPGD